MNENVILECQSLTKKYGNFYALSNLDLTLEKGQIVGLLGPNGSGKTTLIKLINGLLTPTAGQVMIRQMAPSPATKKIVSYLPERSYINPHMKVQEMLTYFAAFYDDFSLETATVMSRDAQLYILDEPIGGVDPAARDYILRMILKNYNEDATLLISTHLITDIENILDRVLFIQNGQLALNASVDEIRTDRGKSVDSLFREVFKC